MADKMGETETEKKIRLCGYAENHEELEKAKKSGAPKPDPESGIAPIPTDFAVGAKIKVNARFAYISGMNFNDAAGLLDYRGHETLEGGAKSTKAIPTQRVEF